MPVVKNHKCKATLGSIHVVLIYIRRFSDFPLTTVCLLVCVNVSIPHIFTLLELVYLLGSHLGQRFLTWGSINPLGVEQPFHMGYLISSEHEDSYFNS